MGEEAARAPKRRSTGDLQRVAEIVMVLSAMGEMRGGRDPAAAEKALAAEARKRLAAACEALKPKDLFPREAVRIVVEDLGLNRSKDPLMGFRPPRMSIAEKLLLTKRKMEESKELSAHSSVYSSQLLPMGFSANTESHGTAFHGGPRFLPDKPSSIAPSSGGLQTSSPVVYAPLLSSGVSSLKQSQVNEKHGFVTPIKLLNNPHERDSSSLKMPHPESGHSRQDIQPNQSAYSTQVRATSSIDYLPERNPTISASCASATTVQGQSDKPLNHGPIKPQTVDEINPVLAPSQEANNKDLKISTQVSTASLLLGHQAPQGLTFVHPPTYLTSHNDIAKSVQRILQQKVFDRPSWTQPSTDYMTTPINCQICKIAITDVESLLVCDHCEKGTHSKCLQSYGNKGFIPKGDWHCPKCLHTSNGKPLPPKYGRVTRAAAASKNPIGTHPLSEKRAESTESKVSLQRSVPNATHPAHASSTVQNAREMQDSRFPASEMKRDERISFEACGNQSNEEVEDVCVAPCKQNENSNKQVENNGLPACEIQESALETNLESDVVSEKSPADHPSRSSINIASQSKFPSDPHIDKTSVPVIFADSLDQMHEINEHNTDHLKESSKSKETSEYETTSSTWPDYDESQKSLSGALYNGDGAGFNGGPSPPHLHTVDWIGNSLDVVEDKTYYQSCHINGILHKLQDHVLVSFNSRNATPSKLCALWEDNNTGKKWAIVNVYYFPNDLPAAPTQPIKCEINEVYASSKETTVMAGSIHGHCEVLQVDKYKEECDRTHLGDTNESSLLIFQCRYKYDESNCMLQPVNL